MSGLQEAHEDSASMRKANILVVDDEPAVAGVLARSLELAGYSVATATSGEDALAILHVARFEVMVTDLHMPRMQGDDLMRRTKIIDGDLAVLLVTAAGDIDCAVRCLHEGAADYISKPFDLHDVHARIEKALDRRELVIEQHRLVAENLNYQTNLLKLVDEQADRLRIMFQNSLQTLNYALEAKDESTRNHSHRVAIVANAIAFEIEGCNVEFINKLKLAAEFHDIGKIGVPEAILQKPSALTREEFELIKLHPEIGENILRPLFSDEELLGIVRGHHEQWNGGGYPDGLSGEEIPIGARIVAVSDGFDAMTSARPYREGLSPERALMIMREGAGTQWDPQIVSIMLLLAERGELASLTQNVGEWTPGLYLVDGDPDPLPTPFENFGQVA